MKTTVLWLLLALKNEISWVEVMNKSRIHGLIYACVIAFGCPVTQAAEGIMHIAATNSVQDTPALATPSGTSQTIIRDNDADDLGLSDRHFLISAGLMGVFMLRRANAS
jgi:hypothetical protein